MKDEVKGIKYLRSIGLLNRVDYMKGLVSIAINKLIKPLDEQNKKGDTNAK